MSRSSTGPRRRPGDGYYYLTNRLSGLSLNVDGGSTADGANVNQWTNNRAAQGQWQIVAV